MRLAPALLLCALLVAATPTPAADEAALWKAMHTPGHVVLIRHAIAPGTGDPPGFRVDDCGTQRNLSEDGRAQARRIGLRFREHGIMAAQVYSSQWCRCLDTARLLALGPVNPLPLLNSFFGKGDAGGRQDRALRDWLARQRGSALVVLVTHQVNISALTGMHAGTGDMVVLRREKDGTYRALGSITSPNQ